MSNNRVRVIVKQQHMGTYTKIGVIGAGLAGLSLAREIEGLAETTVFEKNPQIGGRLRMLKLNDYDCDSASQYFTARKPVFKKFIKPMLQNNKIIQWNPRVMTIGDSKKAYKRDWFEPHYRALPNMNSLLQPLQEELDIRCNVNIDSITYDTRWTLSCNNRNFPENFDYLILAMPAPLSLKMIPQSCNFISDLQAIQMNPMFGLCLMFDEAPKLKYQAAKVKNSVIDWMYIESTKLIKNELHCMVLHSTTKFAKRHFDESQDKIINLMLKALGDLDLNLTEYSSLALDRWPYATVSNSSDEGFYIDQNLRLATCGDWARGGGLEGAYTSGYLLAQELKRTLLM